MRNNTMLLWDSIRKNISDEDEELRKDLRLLVMTISLFPSEKLDDLSKEIFQLASALLKYVDPTHLLNWLLELVKRGDLHEDFQVFIYLHMHKYSWLDEYLAKRIVKHYLKTFEENFEFNAAFSEFLLDQEELGSSVSTLFNTIKFYLENELFGYAVDLYLHLLESFQAGKELPVSLKELDKVSESIMKRFLDDLDYFISENKDENGKIDFIEQISNFIDSVIHSESESVKSILMPQVKRILEALKNEDPIGLGTSIIRELSDTLDVGSEVVAGKKHAREDEIEGRVKRVPHDHVSLIDVPGDGSCFFHAMALHLIGNRRYTARELRDIALQYIRDHINEYIDFLYDFTIDSLEVYFNNMSLMTTDVDHLMIQALSNALNVNIAILNANQYVHLIESQNSQENIQTIAVYHHPGEVHYSGIPMDLFKEIMWIYQNQQQVQVLHTQQQVESNPTILASDESSPDVEIVASISGDTQVVQNSTNTAVSSSEPAFEVVILGSPALSELFDI